MFSANGFGISIKISRLSALSILVALMQENNAEIYSRRFLEKHSLGAPSSLQKATKKLISKELIHQVNGSYEIIDQFFKRWIRHTWG